MLFRLKLRSRFPDAPPTSGVRAVTAVMNPIELRMEPGQLLSTTMQDAIIYHLLV